MVTRRGLTVPEIARRYGRAETTIRHSWTQHPQWPEPIGKRGRYKEYDADAVESVVARLFSRTEPDSADEPDTEQPIAADPNELLDVAAIATYTHLSASTIRSDISRNRWPAPDDETDGTKTWKRSTVEAIMKKRRAYHHRT